MKLSPVVFEQHASIIGGERIIIIIMTDGRNENNQHANVIDGSVQTQEYLPDTDKAPPIAKKITTDAQIDADLLIDEAKSRYRSGKILLVREDQLAIIARKKAKEYVRTKLEDYYTDRDQFNVLTGIYEDSFLALCNKELTTGESKGELVTDSDLSLYKAARADKELRRGAPLSSASEVLALGSLRATQILDRSILDAITGFEDILVSAYKYQRFYSNEYEGEEWPDSQATF